MCVHFFGCGVSIPLVSVRILPFGYTARKVENMDNTEKKDKQRFTANYNGQPIQPGEVMVAFEYNEVEAENYTNPECISTVERGGRIFKVVYKAVAKEWAKEAWSALGLIQNEALGHYAVPNSISMDGANDEYGMELGTVPSTEDVVMKKIDSTHKLEAFVKLMHTLIKKSAKHGFAALLLLTGVKGEEFCKKMELSHNPANRVQQMVKGILKENLRNLDGNLEENLRNIEDMHCYKSKKEESYQEKAYGILDELIRMYR